MREGRPSGHEPRGSLRNPAETVSEPRGKVSETLQKQSPNPVENL